MQNTAGIKGFLSYLEKNHGTHMHAKAGISISIFYPNKRGEEFLSSVLSFSLSIVGILGKNSYLQFFSFGARCKRVAGKLRSPFSETGICKRLQTIEVKFKNWESLVKARTFSSSKN